MYLSNLTPVEHPEGRRRAEEEQEQWRKTRDSLAEKEKEEAAAKRKREKEQAEERKKRAAADKANMRRATGLQRGHLGEIQTTHNLDKYVSKQLH